MEESKSYVPPIIVPHVYITADNRTSSPGLLEKVKHALESMRTPYTELSQVTKPQFGYLIRNHSLETNI